MPVAGVIVAYARVLVDDLGGCVQFIVREAHRNQRRLVAEPSSVEYGAYLPHHVLALEIGDSPNNLLLRDFHLIANCLEWHFD